MPFFGEPSLRWSCFFPVGFRICPRSHWWGSDTDLFPGRGARPIPRVGTRSQAQALSGAAPGHAVGHGGIGWAGGWECPLSRAQWPGHDVIVPRQGRQPQHEVPRTLCGLLHLLPRGLCWTVLGPPGLAVRGGQRPWAGYSVCALALGVPSDTPHCSFPFGPGFRGGGPFGVPTCHVSNYPLSIPSEMPWQVPESPRCAPPRFRRGHGSAVTWFYDD